MEIGDYAECDGLRLFEVQMGVLEGRGELYVINTSVLIALDYSPRILDS